MSLKKRSLTFLLIISLLLTACSNIAIPTNANHAFENFTLDIFRKDIVSSTLGLHYTLQHPEDYGIERYPVTLGTYETDNINTLAVLENIQTALNKFLYKTLSPENQLTYDILSSYITTTREGLDYTLYNEPLSPVTGIHTQLPVLLAEYNFSSTKDVDIYLQLLDTIPEYFRSLISFQQKKSAAGLFMSDENADKVISQCNSFINMGESNYLLSTFEERLKPLNLTPDETTHYLNLNSNLINNTVLPSYTQLCNAISQLKGSCTNTKGLCCYPEGTDYYLYLIASQTGSSRSINEISQLIQTQMASDLLALQNCLNSVSLTDIETFDSSISPNEVLKTLKTRISASFPTSQNVSVQVKYVPKDLETYLSPAFYLIPAIDNYSENTIYINQSHQLDDIHLFTTLAHEGYPGHLYQTTYFASKSPNPLRTLLSFKGYVEGWATYAEMCSFYLSPLDKASATLMQKNNSLILGLYAYADIGIHYEGWDLDQTIKFFSSYGIDDVSVIEEIYQMILGDPANYLAYYVGYLEILEIKKEMMKRKGNDFSQTDFHKRILDVGPAPFDIVKSYVLSD